MDLQFALNEYIDIDCGLVDCGRCCILKMFVKKWKLTMKEKKRQAFRDKFMNDEIEMFKWKIQKGNKPEYVMKVLVFGYYNEIDNVPLDVVYLIVGFYGVKRAMNMCRNVSQTQNI